MVEGPERLRNRSGKEIEVVIIIIIIIINRIQRRYSRFFTISSQRRELSPTRTLKWPRRNGVQITYNMSCYVRATWYEGTAQLFSLTEWKSHLFELYFVG